MLLSRIATIAVGVPVVLAVVFAPATGVFSGCLLIVTALAMRELLTMGGGGAGIPALVFGCLPPAGVFFMGFFPAGGHARAAAVILGAAVLGVFLNLLVHLLRKRQMQGVHVRLALETLAMCYVAVPCAYLGLLRGLPGGAALIAWLLAVTWAGDIGAFLVGSSVGRTPLCPSVSPKKTIEGACGGFAAGLLVAAAGHRLLGGSLSLWQCLVAGMVVNVLNQVGDLLESMLKRSCMVKDSGSLLPGHGGVLDRIDSLLFAAPFLYYYVFAVVPLS